MSGDGLSETLAWVGQQFDLTDYEIDAYLTVLDHGRMSAAEIATQTEIPQPRVYDTVRSLDARGLVELHESRPMQVHALAPSKAFENPRTSLEDLISALEERYSAPAHDAEAVSLVKSRQTIVRQFENVIETAEDELALSLTPALLESFESDLTACRDEGVSVSLLVTPADAAPEPTEYGYESVANTVRARRGITTPVLVVADGTDAVYATQDALRRDRDRYGVVFRRSALGFLVSSFFSAFLWTTATPLVETDPDDAFPRQYATIRRCVKDLATLDGPFYAHVSGRDVETGEDRDVAGRVVETDLGATERTATLLIETEDGEIAVGGRLAALEAIEAHRIGIGYEPIED